MAKIPGVPENPEVPENPAPPDESNIAAKRAGANDNKSGTREEEKSRTLKELDEAPNVKVLGYMDGSIAVRLGWKHGMHVISNSRFKFMREDLDMNIVDEPDDYLF